MIRPKNEGAGLFIWVFTPTVNSKHKFFVSDLCFWIVW